MRTMAIVFLGIGLIGSASGASKKASVDTAKGFRAGKPLTGGQLQRVAGLFPGAAIQLGSVRVGKKGSNGNRAINLTTQETVGGVQMTLNNVVHVAKDGQMRVDAAARDSAIQTKQVLHRFDTSPDFRASFGDATQRASDYRFRIGEF